MWFIENLGTLIVGTIVFGIVAAIVVSIIKTKRRGQCAGCAYSKNCSRACAKPKPKK